MRAGCASWMENAVYHGPGIAGSVGLDDGPRQAQEWRAPHPVRVEELLKLVEPLLHQQGRELGPQAPHKHALHLLPHR